MVNGAAGVGTNLAQSVSGLTLNAGASSVSLTQGTGANKNTSLALGAVTPVAGGTLTVTQPAGTLSATNGVSTTSANTNNILGPYAFVSSSGTAANNTASGFNYATNNGTNIVTCTGATAATTTGSFGGIPSGTNSTVNYDMSGTGNFSNAGATMAS